MRRVVPLFLHKVGNDRIDEGCTPLYSPMVGSCCA